MDGHQLVFVGGLNRSGTTLLGRALAEHPDVSGFANTPAPMDEGMHLQTVYPIAKAHGGAGKFAFEPAAHLTEDSAIATAENAEKLWREWSPWWDLDKHVLVEKSPPNLISARFLQALFPDARFVMIIRHPVAVSLATQRWSKTSLDSLVRHWIAAHDLFERDQASLRHWMVVRYEDLVTDTQPCMDALWDFLDLPRRPISFELRADANDRYFEQWRHARRSLRSKREIARIERDHEPAVNHWGYSFRSPNLS